MRSAVGQRRIRIVAAADIVMSPGDVFAIAATERSMPLLIVGPGIGAPLIDAGAALIMTPLGNIPTLVWAGAFLLGLTGQLLATAVTGVIFVVIVCCCGAGFTIGACNSGDVNSGDAGRRSRGLLS